MEVTQFKGVFLFGCENMLLNEGIEPIHELVVVFIIFVKKFDLPPQLKPVMFFVGVLSKSFVFDEVNLDSVINIQKFALLLGFFLLFVQFLLF